MVGETRNEIIVQIYAGMIPLQCLRMWFCSWFKSDTTFSRKQRIRWDINCFSLLSFHQVLLNLRHLRTHQVFVYYVPPFHLFVFYLGAH